MLMINFVSRHIPEMQLLNWLGKKPRQNLVMNRLVVIALVLATGCAKLTPTATHSPTLAPLPTTTLVPTSTPGPLYWPTDGWRTSTPEQQGMDSERLAEMFEFIQSEKANIHSLLVVRNGYIVVETYWDPFRQDTLHEIRDCTKSITAALVGIAIDKGYIESVDQPVLDFFPDRTIANPDPRKQMITLENLLTMTSSLDWLELYHLYRYPTNSASQMMQSQDWVQFVLDRPMIAEPGEIVAAYLSPGESRSRINSGASHLSSAILQKTSGMNAASFAQIYLLEPLGISDVVWASDPDGISVGGTGIRMRPRDMAKFGYLYLKQGAWEEQQIISADWVKTSFEKHGVVGAHFLESYGYAWWIHVFDAYSATGYGGQYIFVVPDQEIVAVFTAGLEWNDYLPMRLVEFFIIPAAQSSYPLPPNPSGMELLTSQIQSVERPAAQPMLSQPEIAQSISGKRYNLEDNSLGWDSMALSFQETEAVLDLVIGNEHSMLPIGLDGVFRIGYKDRLPVALKGFWQDDQTFIIHHQILGEADRMDLVFSFDEDVVTILLRGFIEGGVEKISGQSQ